MQASSAGCFLSTRSTQVHDRQRRETSMPYRELHMHIVVYFESNNKCTLPGKVSKLEVYDWAWCWLELDSRRHQLDCSRWNITQDRIVHTVRVLLLWGMHYLIFRACEFYSASYLAIQLVWGVRAENIYVSLSIYGEGERESLGSLIRSLTFLLCFAMFSPPEIGSQHTDLNVKHMCSCQ